MKGVKHVDNDTLIFNLIYRVRELEKDLKKAESKIRKLEKGLDLKKIAKRTNKYLGKQAKKAVEFNYTTWSELEKYLGLWDLEDK